MGRRRFTEAWELPPERRRTRRSMEAPEALLAELGAALGDAPRAALEADRMESALRRLRLAR